VFNVNAEYDIQTLMYDIKQYDGEQVVQYIYEDNSKSNMLLLYQHVYAVGNTALLTLTTEEENLIKHHGRVQGLYKEGATFTVRITRILVIKALAREITHTVNIN